jgi:adenosylhomocysteine nucleosidase
MNDTAKPGSAWQVGVVTVLGEETRAVVDVLGLHHLASEPPGQRVYAGRVEGTGASVAVVAARALEQGPRSTMATLEMLWRRYRPTTLVVVGIGGGIHRDVAVDDVVVATRVVYYDHRKETPERTLRRGGERVAPMAVVHAVNAFFNDRGEPAELDSFRAFHGPIGSGDAVIADPDSEIRKYLAAIDYRVLAVDMEAGGLSQFCDEATAVDGITPGWAVIRGISDHADETTADEAKTDAQHHTAAGHAAQTLRHLLPYLGPAGQTGGA